MSHSRTAATLSTFWVGSRRFTFAPCLIGACLAASIASPGAAPVHYWVDLTEHAGHRVHVTMTVPEAGPDTEIQFPTWNALYQIRDFVREVEHVQASCDDRPTELLQADLVTWKTGRDQCRTLRVRYSVYANAEGPYSAVLNDHHSFLNLALLLFYLPQDRQRRARVQFRLPSGWKLVTLLEGPDRVGEFEARNYDALVDSPVEAGSFHEYSYEQGGATYRVVVDSASGDDSPDRLLEVLEKITATETALMQDVPFSRYTFIFHFTPVGGGEAMEHAYGTAITIPAPDAREDWVRLEATVAHEFFHLWNVKRIRPQALEPVDYVRGNDTRDLWFSEGVTNTYQELVLLRAGLISRQDFYRRLAEQIGELEARSARLFQSAEQAGRSAWLEKYADYLRPERSISYYNKGQLLGFLLDLGIRQFSDNRTSLDNLMRRLNRDYVQHGRFFSLDDLRTLTGELAPAWQGREAFFHEAVQGTSELDYDTFLGFAGLRLKRIQAKQAELGFRAVKGVGRPVEVESVDPRSQAAKAGLQRGDILTAMNGQPLTQVPEYQLAEQPLPQKVEFEVKRQGRTLRIRYTLAKAPTTFYRLEEVPNPSPEQLRIREGWLQGNTRSGDY